ncbi:MAG: hypothetical protein IJW40_07085 [Clostridia bacterium]|nr:hypothetical protein [Clostridia bacterium]
MLALKLTGAVLLIGSMVALALSYRRQLVATLSLIRAWRAFLRRMCHAVRSTGVELGEIMRGVERDLPLRRSLLGENVAFETPMTSADEAFGEICRGAARHLPSDAPATAQLAALDEALAAAVSTAQVEELLDALDAKLELLERESARRLDQSWRAVFALCVCGALGLVLVLW